jgi:hypothetical protein
MYIANSYLIHASNSKHVRQRLLYNSELSCQCERDILLSDTETDHNSKLHLFCASYYYITSYYLLTRLKNTMKHSTRHSVFSVLRLVQGGACYVLFKTVLSFFVECIKPSSPWVIIPLILRFLSLPCFGQRGKT